MNTQKSMEVKAMTKAIFCHYNGPPVEVKIDKNTLIVSAPVSFYGEGKGHTPDFGKNKKGVEKLLQCIADKNDIQVVVDKSDMDMEMTPPEQIGGRTIAQYRIDIDVIDDKKLIKTRESLLRVINELHEKNLRLLKRIARNYGLKITPEIIPSNGSLHTQPSLLQLKICDEDTACEFIQTLTKYGIPDLKSIVDANDDWYASIEISKIDPDLLESRLTSALHKIKKKNKESRMQLKHIMRYRRNIKSLKSIIAMLEITDTIEIQDDCDDLTHYKIDITGDSRRKTSKLIKSTFATIEEVKIKTVPYSNIIKMTIEAEMKKYPTTPSGKVKLVPCSPKKFGNILSRIKQTNRK